MLVAAVMAALTVALSCSAFKLLPSPPTATHLSFARRHRLRFSWWIESYSVLPRGVTSPDCAHGHRPRLSRFAQGLSDVRVALHHSHRTGAGSALKSTIDRLIARPALIGGQRGPDPIGSYFDRFIRASPQETWSAANKGATRIISRLGRAGYVGLAAEVFERLCTAVPGGADERSYSAMMSVFNKHEKYSDTLHLLHRMLEVDTGPGASEQQRRLRPDLVVLKCAARAAYFALPWESLPSVLDYAAQALTRDQAVAGEVALASVIETVFTDILHSAENASTCMAHSAELWQWVQQRHPRLLRHQRLADTRFAVACRFGSEEDVRAVCRQRDALGVLPSTFFLNSVLNRCADKNVSYVSAKSVMDRLCALKRGGGTGRVVEPDAVSFDLLLRICLRGGDLRGAREALCDMERRSIPPTAHTKFLQFKLFGEIPYAQYPRELIYHNNASSGNSSSIISANHAAAPPLHVNSPSSLACNATSLQQLLKQSVLPRDVSPHMFCLAIEGAAGREEVVQLLLRARDLLRLNCAVYLAAIRFALKSGDFAFAIEIANSFLDSGLSMSKYGLSSLISLSIRVGWEKGLVLLYRTLHSCKNRTPELLNDAVCDRVIACLTMDGASLPDETAAAEVGSGSADDGHLRSRASPHLALVALQLHSGPLLGLRCRPGTLAKLLRNTASLFNQPNVGSEDSYISSIKLYQTRDADGLSRFASPDLDDICRMVEEIIDSYSAVDNNYFITNKDVAAAVEKLVFTKPNGPKSHKLTNLII